MNKNVRIAKELVKLAKSLVAEENVANKLGDYENFTGNIDWKGTKAKVENATFQLGGINGLNWKDGVWLDGNFAHGVWWNGTWMKGTWNSGIWFDGVWYKGTWEDGKRLNGIWKDGTWERGTWLGSRRSNLWEGGIWEGGKDEKLKFHPAGDSPDKWHK